MIVSTVGPDNSNTLDISQTNYKIQNMKSILLALIVGFFALIPTCNSQTFTLGSLGWTYGYAEVSTISPPLTFYATNLTSTGLVDLYIQYLYPPTQSRFESMTSLTHGTPPGNSLTFDYSIKPDAPYYFALHNESLLPQMISITSNEGFVTVVPEPHSSALFIFLLFFIILVAAHPANKRHW